MSKLSKAIKSTQALNDEEMKDYVEFFKQQEEQVEEKEEIKEEIKVEEKVEEKVIPKEEVEEEVKVESDIQKMFNTMKEQIETLSKKIEKSQPFGVKAKPKGKRDTSEFDDVFAGLDGQKG